MTKTKLKKIIYCNNPQCSFSEHCLRFKADANNRFIPGIHQCIYYISDFEFKI